MKHISILILIIFISSCWAEKTPIQENIIFTPTNNMQKEDINQDEERLTISEPLPVIQEEEPKCLVFDDFTDTTKNNWLMVNDGVMWGKSIGSYSVENDVFKLFGTINTNGGWFSSVRAWLPNWILSEYNTIVLSAKADSRSYQITFRDNNRRWISHRGILPFQNIWEFEEIEINIAELEAVYFWRRVNADDFKKDFAREIGFILNDGKDGVFKLAIDSIAFCK